MECYLIVVHLIKSWVYNNVYSIVTLPVSGKLIVIISLLIVPYFTQVCELCSILESKPIASRRVESPDVGLLETTISLHIWSMCIVNCHVCECIYGIVCSSARRFIKKWLLLYLLSVLRYRSSHEFGILGYE